MGKHSPIDALSRIEKLPNWPGRMTAPVAAAYMGISHNTFLSRFGSLGVREGGNVLWARAQLDKMIGEQFNLRTSPVDDSPSAGKTPYDSWKEGQ